jgi:hypothetical protein
MADNTTLNSGSGGDVIATDDISGVKYQRVKLALGADGAASDAPIGGGVESGSLRVTIASDSTGVLSVDDNGGSLTVDNGGTFAVQATVEAGATNIAKAEDVASADADVGVPAMAVRKATPANTSGTDGDYEMLQMSAGRLWVDPSGVTLTVASHAVTNAGTFAVQESGTHVRADDAAYTVASDKGVVIMGVATSDTVDANDAGAVAMTTSRSLKTVVTNSTGTIIDPQTDDAAYTPASGLVSVIGGIVTTDSVDSGDAGALGMAADRTLYVSLRAQTAGGSTPYQNLDCDESEDDIKTSPGQLFWVHAINLANAKRYLKFYNATAANTTVGSTTPVLTFTLPTQGDSNGAGFAISFPCGVVFDTAICVAATTGFAIADTGAPGTNDVILNCGYK